MYKKVPANDISKKSFKIDEIQSKLSSTKSWLALIIELWIYFCIPLHACFLLIKLMNQHGQQKGSSLWLGIMWKPIWINSQFEMNNKIIQMYLYLYMVEVSDRECRDSERREKGVRGSCALLHFILFNVIYLLSLL